MGSEIAIAGAGLTGSYLYRLLLNRGIMADLYDEKASHVSCGINPCAWGATSPFRDRVREAKLDPERYVMRDFDMINFENVDMQAKLLTFDKPRLITDLREGAEIRSGHVPKGRYDRVIDATGTERAYLPRVKDDLLVPCVQYRVKRRGGDDSKVVIRYGNLGYSWIFPLRDDEYHIGAGSVLADPRSTIKESGFLRAEDRVICACAGRVRSTSPNGCLPFFVNGEGESGSVWGVGESIGAVAPIAGEGVVPGMTCAKILVENLDDSAGYETSVLREFSWMMDERRVIAKVAAGTKLKIGDWIILRRTGRRMGSSISLAKTREVLRGMSLASSGDGSMTGPTKGECAK